MHTSAGMTPPPSVCVCVCVCMCVRVRAFVGMWARAFALVREPAVLCFGWHGARLQETARRPRPSALPPLHRDVGHMHMHTLTPTTLWQTGQRPPPPPFSSCVFRAPWPWALVSMRQWTPAVKQAPPLPLLAAPLSSWQGMQA